LHLSHALLHIPLLQQETPQVVVRAGEGGIDTGRLAVEQHGQPQELGLFIRRAQTVEEVRIGHDFGQGLYHTRRLLWVALAPVQISQVAVRQQLRGLQ
jgi:hypothetical protein